MVLPTAPFSESISVWFLWSTEFNQGHWCDHECGNVHWSLVGSPMVSQQQTVISPVSIGCQQLTKKGCALWSCLWSICDWHWVWYMSISDSNRGCKITISLSVPCSEESISQSFSLPSVSYILSGSSSTVIPWLYIGGTNLFFWVELSAVTNSQHLEQPCVSAFTALLWKEKLLWLRLGEAIVYGHKHK